MSAVFCENCAYDVTYIRHVKCHCMLYPCLFLLKTLVIHLEDDKSYVQKCSIVDGSVQCSRIDNLKNMSYGDQRQALDDLIQQYRQQLTKLKVGYL